jgi:hypothetical protein
MTITDERARFATFLGGNIIRWDFDQQTYSLTRVCDLICEKFGGDDGLGFSGNGTDYWAIEDDTFSLYERSKLPSSGAELQGVLTAKVDS